MQTVLFIAAVDEWFTSKGLPFLSTVADVAAIVLLTLLICRVSTKSLVYLLERRRMRLPEDAGKRLKTASSLLSGVIKFTCLFVAVAMIMGEIGLKNAMTSMLAAAGIGGLALGIGAQSLIGDVSSGLFMLMENELNVGDYVAIEQLEGTVEAVSLRTTSIRGPRGELSIINNGQIKTVINYSRGDYLVFVEAPIAYEADVDRARTAMAEEAARYAHENNIEHDPIDFGVIALGGSGVTLRVGLSTPPMERWVAERTLRTRIKARFDEEGIEIPYDKLIVFQGDAHKA